MPERTDEASQRSLGATEGALVSDDPVLWGLARRAVHSPH